MPVLAGVGRDLGALVLEFEVLFKSFLVTSHLTGKPVHDFATVESWCAVAEGVLSRMRRAGLLNAFPNLRLAFGVLWHYVLCTSKRDLPIDFLLVVEHIDRVVAGDLGNGEASDVYGLPLVIASQFSGDLAFPPAVACVHCRDKGSLCMIGGYQRACLRCHVLGKTCVFASVRVDSVCLRGMLTRS